ncbi:MAG: hypothetical protein AAF958_02045 [Planctomycetota bacterium]
MADLQAPVRLCVLTSLMMVASLAADFSRAEESGESAAPGSTITVPGFDVKITRQGHQLQLSWPDNSPRRERKMPRVYTSLRDVLSINVDGTRVFTVTPEPDHWRVHRVDKKPWSGKLTFRFDRKPIFASELQPIAAQSDGTFVLRAESATVQGQKVRFEPQPHKNTIGYWTGRDDSATWTLRTREAGDWNVGILQGCGKNQGGSDAQLTLLDSRGGRIDELDFKVQETGHFQNFVWRHLGSVSMPQPGVYKIRIQPKEIAHAALMDVRMIHLSPRR